MRSEITSSPAASRYALRQAIIGRYAPLVNEAIAAQARAEEEAVCALRRGFESSPKPVAPGRFIGRCREM